MDKQELIDLYLRYRNIIFPVLVGVVSIILVAFVIYPQLNKLRENNDSYNKIVNKSDFLEVKANELESIDETDLQEKVRIALSALPDGQDYAQVISLLQDVAGESGFIISSINFVPGTQTATGRSEFTVRMEVGGPKNGFNTLLTNIESAYRPMRVSNFEVNTASSGEVLNAIISVNVFYAPLPQSLGGVDSKLPILTSQDEELMSLLARSDSAGESGSLISSPKGKSDPFE